MPRFHQAWKHTANRGTGEFSSFPHMNPFPTDGAKPGFQTETIEGTATHPKKFCSTLANKKDIFSQVAYNHDPYDNSAKMQMRERQGEKAKQLHGAFKTGNSSKPLLDAAYAELRGDRVVKADAGANARANSCQMTCAEQMLFGNRFKKSEKILKPANNARNGFHGNFEKVMAYEEHGEAIKENRPKIPAWV